MKCFVAIVLLGICLQLSTACLADDKADLAALKSEMELLQKQLADLKSQLAEVERERDELRAELKQTGSKEAPTDAPDVAPVGTTWTGKQFNQKGEGHAMEWSVTAREGKNVTFLATGEFGSIWEYDGTFTSPRDFKIVAVRRIQKSKKVKIPDAVGAITGRGSITAKNQMTAEVSWNNAKLELKFLGDFVEPKAKE